MFAKALRSAIKTLKKKTKLKTTAILLAKQSAFANKLLMGYSKKWRPLR